MTMPTVLLLVGVCVFLVQFCANDPDTFLAASKLVEPLCDGIDLNLGCPQSIAKRGNYGAFLQDEWDLVYSIGMRQGRMDGV